MSSTKDLEHRKFKKDSDGNFSFTENGSSQVIVSGEVSTAKGSIERNEMVEQTVVLNKILRELKIHTELFKILIGEDIENGDLVAKR